MKYLKKTDTGEIFHWNPYLAERMDMEPYDGPVPWEEARAKDDAITSEADEFKLPEFQDQATQEAVSLISIALDQLDPEDWLGDEPKIGPLTKACGFKPKKSEISLALKIRRIKQNEHS